MLFFHYVTALLVLTSQHVISSCPCKDELLCNPVKRTPKKEVFVFLRNLGPEAWPMFDWSRITTIACPGHDYAYLSKLMCLCHQYSVRLVSQVGLGMPTENLTNPIMRRNWVSKHLKYIIDNHLDGINLDIEASIYYYQTEIRNGYTQLALEMKQALYEHNPYSQLTVDVYVAPNLYARYYNYTALGMISDFLFVMEYNEGGGFPAKANSDYVTNKIGFKMYNDIGVPASKLMAGIPWFGYGWECLFVLGDNCYPPLNIDGRADRRLASTPMFKIGTSTENLKYLPKFSPPSFCYSAIADMLKSGGVERKWNSRSKTPFFFFKDSSSKLRQMQYDDPESLTLKTKMAIDLDLRGVGVFISDCLDWSNTTEAAKERVAMWNSLPKYI